MTVEDRCKVCKELIKWSAFEDSSVMYMEDKVYAVAVGIGVVALVEANNPDEAYEKIFGFKRRGEENES
jgi:hypothetical protein